MHLISNENTSKSRIICCAAPKPRTSIWDCSPLTVDLTNDTKSTFDDTFVNLCFWSFPHVSLENICASFNPPNDIFIGQIEILINNEGPINDKPFGTFNVSLNNNTDYNIFELN